MSHRLKHAVPLAISIGLVAFIWSELTLRFNLHWFTVADGVLGKFGLPEKFQLVLPATFVTWGLYYALGADRAAFRNTLISRGDRIAVLDGPLAAVEGRLVTSHNARSRV